MSKLKIHLKRHKTFYVGLGTGIVLAGITVLIVKGRLALQSPPGPSFADSGKELCTKLDARMEWSEKTPTGSFIYGYNNHNNTITTIHNGGRGHSGYVTRCVETGELFATQGDAARTYGIPETILSKHLNYGRDLVENLTFERVGLLEG